MISERFNEPKDQLCVPIGMDITSDLVSLNFSSPSSPHLLVAGTTGSGKSVALETIIDGLIDRYPPEALKLGLVDPKRVEMDKYEDSPYLLDEQIYYDPDEAVDLLDRSIDEMESRYRIFSENKPCKDLRSSMVRSVLMQNFHGI